MGDVVPFIAKVRSNGDWTAAERARLEELAERVSAAEGAHVETVFGVTDTGDPWCVVTDEHGEVLIHVARIGGRFVIHSAVDDALSEGADLHVALRERLNGQEDSEDDAGVVVPFSLAGRHAQTFLALVIATAFFYETGDVAEAAEAPPSSPPDLPALAPPPPPADLKAPTQERELAIQGAVLSDPPSPRGSALTAAPMAKASEDPAAERLVAELVVAEAPHPVTAVEASPPTPSEATPEPELVIAGGSGDDLLIGTDKDERILGGDGDDTLIGGGGADSLEGGEGADQIHLGVGVVATGGAGADTFVIEAPETLGDASTLLGVVTDFNLDEGDRLVLSGRSIDVPPPPQAPPGGEPASLLPPGFGGPADRSADPGPPGLRPDIGSFGPATAEPQVRIEVDLDGDGLVDGYVLVTVTGQAGVHALPLSGSGTGFGWDDPFA